MGVHQTGGGSVRFRAAELRHSARDYRTALTPAKTAAALGVPAYCLPAFVEAGLLAEVLDPDALRLAATPALYTRRSLEALLQSLHACCGALEYSGVPLAPMMRRLFRPTDWARVFQALVTGELKLDYALEPTDRPILLQLQVSQEEGLRFVSPLRGQPPGVEALLTAAEAGLLLGVHAVYAGELIEEGLLPARREGRTWRVTLGDVVAFDKVYVLSPELMEPEALEDGSPAGRPPYDIAAYTRHILVYALGPMDEEPATRAETRDPPERRQAAAQHPRPGPEAQASFEAALLLHAVSKGQSAEQVRQMLDDLRGHRI